MQVDPNYLGRNGLYYFTGIVEGRNDPLKLGRVQVRCYGIHSDLLTDMPTAELPWFYVGLGTNSASISGVGTSPSGLVEGSTVLGIFLDGFDSQEGVVICSIPAIPLVSSNKKAYSDQRTDLSSAPKVNPQLTFNNGITSGISDSAQTNYPRYLDEPDTSKLSRGVDDPSLQLKAASRSAGQTSIPMALGGSWSQPATTYAAVYPFNHVMQSESGHVQEFDDTPGAERINLMHRVGSFIEFNPGGSVVYKSISSKYDICHNSSYEHVEGTKVITVDKGFKILVNKDSEGVGYDLEIAAGAPLNITIRQGDANVTVENGNMQTTVNGNMTSSVSGTFQATIGSNATIDAPVVTINTPSTICTGNLSVAGGLSVLGTGGGSGANITGNVNVNSGDVNVNSGSANISGGDVVADGISLKTHRHIGVRSGPDTSGTPI